MKTKRVRLLVSFLLVLFGFLSVFRAASAEEMSGKANLTTIAQEKTQGEKTQEEKIQIEKSYNEETEAVSPSKEAVPDLSVTGSERHPGESQCEPMETMRATYNDVFASLKGNGYSLSEGISSARSAFTTGDFVYAWAYVHDGNGNLYHTYTAGVCDMTLSIYRPDGSCAHSYTYTDCDNNWIGTRLDTPGTWKIRSQVSGSITGDNIQEITVVDNTVTYTVSYDANGGTGTPQSQVKAQNTTLALSTIIPTKKYTIYYNANGGSVSPANKSVSCTFRNWNTARNGSGTSYSPGGSYTANANVTLYAQWSNPSAGTLATPTRSGYAFQGWYTSASGGTKVTSSSVISGNCTLYAHWSDPYNLGDETYSFQNFSDSDSGGHCFGMSATSGAYYNNLLNISLIGGNASSALYNFSNTQTVRAPICYYQARQGSYARRAIVAGGSYYTSIFGWSNIASDWQAVVNYVSSHQYDGTGLLQIGLRGTGGGHAVNFLRYENVNGQDRIYAYDNNFPNRETYFYRDSNGNVLQAPVSTFGGAIESIALRDLRTYFNLVGDYDGTRVVYVDNDAAEIQGYTFSYMEGTISGGNYVMYEIPENVKQVTIVPKKNNADFIYLDTEYSFGNVTDGTYGVLVLSSMDEQAGGPDVSFHIYQTAGWHNIDGKWYYYDDAGTPVTGWKKVGSTWYYMNNQGVMQTGWKQISGKWYYFQSSGAMVTGWKKISNVTYYFKPSGAMAAKEWCSGWWLNANGSWTYQYKASWKKNARGWWYGDTSGWYAKNTTITIDGKKYTFDANGYWVK